MLKCLPAGGCHVRRGTAVITGGPRLRQDIYHHPEDPVSDPGTPDHPGEASGDHLYQRSGSIHEAALCADISTGSAYRQFWNISFCFLSNIYNLTAVFFCAVLPQIPAASVLPAAIFLTFPATQSLPSASLSPLLRPRPVRSM